MTLQQKLQHPPLFQNSWNKIGQTELINDNLNPQWVTKIETEYYFEKQEIFKVEVYDVDNDNEINTQDFLGRLEFSLHEVVTSQG